MTTTSGPSSSAFDWPLLPPQEAAQDFTYTNADIHDTSAVDGNRVSFSARVLDTAGRGDNAVHTGLRPSDWNRITTTDHGVKFCNTFPPTKGNARKFCGKVRTCNVCAIRNSNQRRDALIKPVSEAPHVLALTLTIKHTSAPLDVELDALMRVRLRWTERGTWAVLKNDLGGIDGVVIAIEITRSRDGWHPHVHALLTTSRRLTRKARQQAQDALVQRWLDAADHCGQLAAPSAQAASWVPLGWDRVRAVEYVVKGSLDYTGDTDGLAPGGIQARAAAGDLDAQADWIEYVEGVRNRPLPPIHQYGKRLRTAATAPGGDANRAAA